MSIVLARAESPDPPSRRLRVVAPISDRAGVFPPGPLVGVPPSSPARPLAPPPWACTTPPGPVEVVEDWVLGRTLPVLAGFVVAGFAGGWWHTGRRG